MADSRRSLLMTSSVAGPTFGMASLLRTGLAAQATPEGTPMDEPLSSETIYESLRASAVTSPLFPADTGEIMVTEWIDSGDDDLQGVVGGLLLQVGKGEDAPLVGVYIVHPTEEMARVRIEAQLGESSEITQPMELFGYSGAWKVEPGNPTPHTEGADTSYSLVALAVGTLIVSAIGEGENRDANMFRALANLAGMLDHLGLTNA